MSRSRDTSRRGKERKRSRSREKKRSPSREKRRSRSREKRRSRSRDKRRSLSRDRRRSRERRRSRDRKSPSRSRDRRRSRERRPRSRSRPRRSWSRAMELQRKRSAERLRKKSRSPRKRSVKRKSRSRVREPSVVKVDKAQLLEAARKNMQAMLQRGVVAKGLPVAAAAAVNATVKVVAAAVAAAAADPRSSLAAKLDVASSATSTPPNEPPVLPLAQSGDGTGPAATLGMTEEPPKIKRSLAALTEICRAISDEEKREYAGEVEPKTAEEVAEESDSTWPISVRHRPRRSFSEEKETLEEEQDERGLNWCFDITRGSENKDDYVVVYGRNASVMRCASNTVLAENRDESESTVETITRVRPDAQAPRESEEPVLQEVGARLEEWKWRCDELPRTTLRKGAPRRRRTVVAVVVARRSRRPLPWGN
ncbi:hypothetical protein MTO96_050799 [Rhipicephalus appendiculatus]